MTRRSYGATKRTWDGGPGVIMVLMFFAIRVTHRIERKQAHERLRHTVEMIGQIHDRALRISEELFAAISLHPALRAESPALDGGLFACLDKPCVGHTDGMLPTPCGSQTLRIGSKSVQSRMTQSQADNGGLR